MPQLPSPNQGKQYTKVEGRYGLHYQSSHPQLIVEYQPLDPRKPELGVQAVEKVEQMPDNPEIIDLTSGTSNSQYWQPEVIINPIGCNHHFIMLNSRDAECVCGLTATIHPALNYREKEGVGYVVFKGQEYPVTK